MFRRAPCTLDLLGLFSAAVILSPARAIAETSGGPAASAGPLAGGAAAPPAGGTSAGEPAPLQRTTLPPRAWVYTFQLGDRDQDGAAAIPLVMFETTRRTVAGRQVIELAAEVNGQRVTLEDLSATSLAPFQVFGVHWSLLFGRDARGRRVDLTLGSQPLDDGSFSKDPEQVAATWWPAARPPAHRKSHTPDQAFLYRSKVGAWPSLCMGHVHPSPDTGDFYRWERCFAPRVGVTRLSFQSVWGSFDCVLKRPPSQPALP